MLLSIGCTNYTKIGVPTRKTAKPTRFLSVVSERITVFERLHSCTAADTLIRQLELLEADKASGPDELQPRNLSEEETENPWQDR